MGEPWRKRVVIGDATLYLGDCLQVLPTLEKVDAVITDPPYDVDFEGKRNKINPIATGGYEGGDSGIGPVAAKVFLQNCDRAIIFPGSRLMFDYPKPYEIGCVYCPGGAGMGRWGFTVIHPMLYYGVGLVHTRQSPGGFESFEVSEKNGHPCPKPIGWMRWAVNKCTVAGHTVLDPFLGSGTTAVACIAAGRKFIGIEIEPKYFDIACERITNAQRQTKLFDEPKGKPEQHEMLP